MAATEPTDIRVELVHDRADVSVPAPRAARTTEWREGGSKQPRRGGIATLIAAVVVAGSIGIAIGRAGSGADPIAVEPADRVAFGAATTPTSQADARGEQAEPTLDTIPRVTDRADLPRDDAGQRQAPTLAGSGDGQVDEVGTGEPAGAAIEPVGIDTSNPVLDPRIIGSDLQIVAPRQDGRWARLDLRNGRLDVIADVDPSTFLTDQPVVAGDGWFAYGRADGTVGTAAWTDASEVWRTLPIVAEQRLLREADTEHFWMPLDPQPVGSANTFGLVDLGGARLGETITVPTGASVQGSDPAGGLIVWGGGRLFRMTPDEQTAVAAGDLIAANAVVVASRSCDESFVCALEVTDRRTGETRRVDVDSDDGAEVGPVVNPDVIGASDLSWPLTADGDVLAVTTASEIGFVLGALDLSSGAYQRVAEYSRPFSAVWTPDGRYLLYVNSGIPFAFDRSTGETFAVTPGGELGGWNGLVAVR